jgi:hypothetical protein
VLLAAPCDHGLNVAPPELATVLVVVVTAIGDCAIRALPEPITLARDRTNPVDERQQLGDVVAVGAGERCCQGMRGRRGSDGALSRCAHAQPARAGKASRAGHRSGLSRRFLATSRSARRHSVDATARGARAPTPRQPASRAVAATRSLPRTLGRFRWMLRQERLEHRPERVVDEHRVRYITPPAFGVMSSNPRLRGPRARSFLKPVLRPPRASQREAQPKRPR